MIMLNNNLRIFITVAEIQSLTATAKKLYVSQPAISHAIRKLEEELGVRLFIRNKRSTLTLTEAGKDILALAYKMADLENRLYQRAYEENHLTGGILRIATVPLGASLIMARVLLIFKKQFPDVKVEMLEGTPLEVKNMVLNYQVDIGISTSPYMGLEHNLLMMDRMISVNRDGAVHIDLKDDSANLVLCRMAYNLILEQLAGEDIDLSHSTVMEAASTQINMVEEGNGVGVISELMLSTIPNQLVHGTVIPEIKMEISLIAHSFSELGAAAKEMADMILERSVMGNINVVSKDY